MNQSISTLNPILLHSTCFVLWRNSLEIVNVAKAAAEKRKRREKMHTTTTAHRPGSRQSKGSRLRNWSAG
jgi:hypothetical protein